MAPKAEGTSEWRAGQLAIDMRLLARHMLYVFAG